MFKMALLCSAALIASVGIAMRAGAQESAIPNFTSTKFGWLLDTGLHFDFRPIEGKVAPVESDPNWRAGSRFAENDFSYQAPEAGSDPHPRGESGNNRQLIERLSDAENPNL